MRLDIDRLREATFIARAEHHAVLGSTNDRARQLAGEPAEGLPLLIVADQQTAGRGRGTNRWWTGPGSLALSLLLDSRQVPLAEPSQSPLVALAVAVALVETLAPRLPHQTVGIHWPNDVMAAGRKLAGILIEATPERRFIVGIGVNTNNSMADAPAELKTTATTMLDLTGQAHDPTTLLIDLLGNLQRGFGGMAESPESIALRADRLCLQHGRPLTLRSGNRTISGRCEGIAPDGALKLDTSEGRRTFYSGVLLPGNPVPDSP